MFTDSMFVGCKNLKSIKNLGGSITNANNAFEGCTSLEQIDTSPFKNVKSANYMFDSCKNLKNISFSNFKQLRNIGGIFFNCESITDIDLTNLGITNESTKMFCGCKNLKHVKIPANFNLTPSTFSYCKNLKDIDFTGSISDWNSLIEKLNPNSVLKTISTVHCEDGDILPQKINSLPKKEAKPKVKTSRRANCPRW